VSFSGANPDGMQQAPVMPPRSHAKIASKEILCEKATPDNELIFLFFLPADQRDRF